MSAKSVADRAAQGEGQEPDPELFPMGKLEGDGVTLKTLVKGGQENRLTGREAYAATMMRSRGG
jgi:hypothetical protein